MSYTVGDRVGYSGFYGDLDGVITEIIGCADGSVFEFVVFLDNGKTAFAKPPQVTSVEGRCKMCSSYGRPGWIFNAYQWIRCFDCNPTTPR